MLRLLELPIQSKGAYSYYVIYFIYFLSRLFFDTNLSSLASLMKKIYSLVVSLYISVTTVTPISMIISDVITSDNSSILRSDKNTFTDGEKFANFLRE